MTEHAPQSPAKLAEPLRLDEIHLWSLPYQPQQRRLPLRRVLGRYLGIAPEVVALREGAHGRPELATEGPPSLRFNWSHSGDRALVAVAGAVQPGVDLELVGRRAHPRVDAIAARYFAPDEVAFLAGVQASRRENAFLRIWTAKEALLKAQGQGLSFGLHRLAVDASEAAPVLHRFDGEALACWQLHALAVGDAHVAALAWRGAPMQLRWMTAAN